MMIGVNDNALDFYWHGRAWCDSDGAVGMIMRWFLLCMYEDLVRQ